DYFCGSFRSGATYIF
nr:immunoglobulin light chain junction region [Macaca mulatta]